MSIRRKTPISARSAASREGSRIQIKATRTGIQKRQEQEENKTATATSSPADQVDNREEGHKDHRKEEPKTESNREDKQTKRSGPVPGARCRMRGGKVAALPAVFRAIKQG